MTVTARAARLLPVALLLVAVPAVLAGLPGSGAPPDAGPDAASESVGAGSVVDLAAERAVVLAEGRAVDAGWLQPGLEAALAAARNAANVELPVSSGHRSAEAQLATLEREIAERGSIDDALTWVFLPADSMHVRGLAIDIGSGPAADWLHVHGARFGLCKTLAWEWWHFEWRQRWQDEGVCPRAASTRHEAPPA